MTVALIAIPELHALLATGGTTVLDVRYSGPGSSGGREAYLAGHIPGAVFVDMDDELASPAVGPGGRHPLPDAQDFQEAMRRAGVSNDRPVVIYDDWFSIAAARAWWLLRLHGHRHVRVLDGGWRAWQESSSPVATGGEEVSPGDFTPARTDVEAIDAEGAAHLAAGGVLLDARPANRFRGEDETIDPIAGHIPGARSLPALELVDSSGRLLAPDVLRHRFEAAGAVANRVGVYCGSGIQAAHVALAATVAGLPTPAVYAGSWSDWITDPSRPVATGE
ncbi:sulfurtransferase [Arachnia propionica]|uniref:Sulfurtransferase n=1 Tax=Arachnia propionica TaxID=1750 RepID=A0A3P1X348_9ACTN|nr:sulfurtransferase [Arachnia propionica]RRD51183.1 sulfurtransferase [Arachnia propionica]